MDGILKGQGLTAGTVGERMTALGKQKRFQFPEGDEGRAQIMAYLQGRIADIRTRLPRAFATLVPGNLEIKRMPPEVEPGAPGAYGGPGTIDGKVPGKFWINLHTTSGSHDLQPADARLSRVDSGSRVAGRVHVQIAAVPARCSLSTPTRKAGRFTPNSSPTSSASTKAIRSADWVICSRLHSVLVGSSSIRACMPNAGRASRHPVVCEYERVESRGSEQRGRSLLRVAGSGLRIQSRSQRDQPAADRDEERVGREVRSAPLR